MEGNHSSCLLFCQEICSEDQKDLCSMLHSCVGLTLESQNDPQTNESKFVINSALTLKTFLKHQLHIRGNFLLLLDFSKALKWNMRRVICMLVKSHLHSSCLKNESLMAILRGLSLIPPHFYFHCYLYWGGFCVRVKSSHTCIWCLLTKGPEILTFVHPQVFQQSPCFVDLSQVRTLYKEIALSKRLWKGVPRLLDRQPLSEVLHVKVLWKLWSRNQQLC